mmetsp:Transcript_58968/g.125275  ORF Transcript_58968/g.125275 Transcript_58968/m.125275 type:complete len:351 (-) Transcript_58968:359-1411(-)
MRPVEDWTIPPWGQSSSFTSLVSFCAPYTGEPVATVSASAVDVAVVVLVVAAVSVTPAAPASIANDFHRVLLLFLALSMLLIRYCHCWPAYGSKPSNWSCHTSDCCCCPPPPLFLPPRAFLPPRTFIPPSPPTPVPTLKSLKHLLLPLSWSMNCRQTFLTPLPSSLTRAPKVWWAPTDVPGGGKVDRIMGGDESCFLRDTISSSPSSIDLTKSCAADDDLPWWCVEDCSLLSSDGRAKSKWSSTTSYSSASSGSSDSVYTKIEAGTGSAAASGPLKFRPIPRPRSKSESPDARGRRRRSSGEAVPSAPLPAPSPSFFPPPPPGAPPPPLLLAPDPPPAPRRMVVPAKPLW